MELLIKNLSNYKHILVMCRIEYYGQYDRCENSTALWHRTIYGTPHNIWNSTQYVTHRTIYDTPHNIWHTAQYMTHRTIHDAPHNMTHHTIYDTPHNIWHTAQNTTHRTIWHTTWYQYDNICLAPSFVTNAWCKHNVVVTSNNPNLH